MKTKSTFNEDSGSNPQASSLQQPDNVHEAAGWTKGGSTNDRNIIEEIKRDFRKAKPFMEVMFTTSGSDPSTIIYWFRRRKFTREYLVTIEGEPNFEPIGCSDKAAEERTLTSLHALGMFADEVEGFYQTTLKYRVILISAQDHTDHFKNLMKRRTFTRQHLFTRQYLVTIEGEPNYEPILCSDETAEERTLASSHALGMIADEVERFYQTTLKRRVVLISAHHRNAH